MKIAIVGANYYTPNLTSIRNADPKHLGSSLLFIPVLALWISNVGISSTYLSLPNKESQTKRLGGESNLASLGDCIQISTYSLHLAS